MNNEEAHKAIKDIKEAINNWIYGEYTKGFAFDRVMEIIRQIEEDEFGRRKEDE